MNDEYYKELFLEKFRYIRDNGELLVAGYSYSSKIVDSLEQVLLVNKPLEQIEGYKYLESIKNNQEFLNKAKKYIEQANKIEELMKRMNYSKATDFNAWNVFELVYNNIQKERNESLKNHKKDVINEYARMARYSNDGNVWTSGVEINSDDATKYHITRSWILSRKEEVSKELVVGFNDFIDFFSCGHNIINDTTSPIYGEDFTTGTKYQFSEDEKQKVYLETHKELPWNMMITCSDEGNINRPDGISCGKRFHLVKENIYKDSNDNFLTVCPNCGNITIINKDLLDSNTIRYVNKHNDDNDEEINYHKSYAKVLEYKKINKR